MRVEQTTVSQTKIIPLNRRNEVEAAIFISPNDPNIKESVFSKFLWDRRTLPFMTVSKKNT